MSSKPTTLSKARALTKDLVREQSADEHTEEKPADHDPGTGDCPGDKTISRVPQRPEAPPPLNLGPLPEPPLAPGLEAPPPADLPPLTPADPDPLGSVPGEGEHRPGGYEPPVLTVPVLVAPAPVRPVHILGTSIAPRWTPGGRPVETSWPAGEPSSRLLRASAYDPATRDPMLTSSGVTAPGQPYRTGFNEYSPRPLAQMAAGALPGVAGLATVTAFGIASDIDRRSRLNSLTSAASTVSRTSADSADDKRVRYAHGNVGCGQHVVKRFFIPPAPALSLMADAPNLAQFVSRRSILPTGNLATLC